MINRTSILTTLLSLNISLFAGGAIAASDTSVVQKVIDVHKSPTCGCCTGWVEHMKENGYKTLLHHSSNLTEIKNRSGVPANARSCHTAISKEGFIFEGHIPAKFVTQFLENPPEGARGLIVPAMPIGSPGMEYNNQFMSYSVLLLNEDGSVSPYAEIDQPEDQY